MIEYLLDSLGLPVATLAIAFIAGMFPLVSIELFLVGCTAWGVEPPMLAVLIAIALVGHQVAKTITYYAGAGVFRLPRGKVRDRIEAAKARVARWNHRPRLVMFVAAATGLPPLYLLGFLAQPMMQMSIATFTAISAAGRLARYVTLVVVTGWF